MPPTALGMGDGWEINIARLIDQANETLARRSSSKRNVTSPSSTLFARNGNMTNRRRNSSHFLRGGAGDAGSDVSQYHHAGASSSTRRPYHRFGDLSAVTRRPLSSVLNGEHRRASYLRDTGWDVPRPKSSALLAARPVPSSRKSFAGGTDERRSRSPPPPPLLSREAKSRVNDAKIDGMEDRIKLEVHTMVRRDVEQRVSKGEQATDTLQGRVKVLASELSGIDAKIQNFSTATHSQGDELDKLQADTKRNRSDIVRLDGWRTNQEGWYARADASLASLSEDTRVLTRRCQNQHEARGESVTQEDLSVAVKAALKAAEAATATALAPVREHFMQELGAVRRRQSAMETMPPPPSAVPQVSPEQVKLTAEDAASAMGEKLWQRVDTHMRVKMLDGAKEVERVALEAKREVDRRLAEVEAHAGELDSAIQKLQDGKAASEDLGGLRDSVLALQRRLEDGITCMDTLCDRRSREARHGAEEIARLASDGFTMTLDTAIRGLNDRLKRVEEPERHRAASSLGEAALTTPSPPPLVPTKEELDSVLNTVQMLVSRTDVATKQQMSSEERMEELSEKVCGHSLKLRCLEGLWREAVHMDNEVPREAGTDNGGGSSMNRSAGTGIDADDGAPTDNQQRQAIEETIEADEAASAKTSRRVGVGGFLQRLGSMSSSLSRHTEGGKKVVAHKTGALTDTKQPSTQALTTDTAPRSKTMSGLPEPELATSIPIQHETSVRSIMGEQGKTSVIDSSDGVSSENNHKKEAIGETNATTQKFSAANTAEEDHECAKKNNHKNEAVGETSATTPTLVAANTTEKGHECAYINFGDVGGGTSDEGGCADGASYLRDEERIDTAPITSGLNTQSKAIAPIDMGTPVSGGQQDTSRGGSIRTAPVEAPYQGNTHLEDELEQNELARKHADTKVAAEIIQTVESLPPVDLVEGSTIANNDVIYKGLGREEGEDDAKLEEKNSVQGSVQSWSLPGSGLQEQRAVWGDVAGESGEQSLSWADGTLESTSHSRPWSRVGSYDLEDETGDGRMGPISPDGATSPTAEAMTLVPSTTNSPPVDIPDDGLVGGEENVFREVESGSMDAKIKGIEANPVGEAVTLARVMSVREPIVASDDKKGTDTATVLVPEFDFSDDDEELEPSDGAIMGLVVGECPRLAALRPDNQDSSGDRFDKERSNGDSNTNNEDDRESQTYPIARDSGLQTRGKRVTLDDLNNKDDNSEDHGQNNERIEHGTGLIAASGGGEEGERHARTDRTGHPDNNPGLASTNATPVSSKWVPPDLGFSSSSSEEEKGGEEGEREEEQEEEEVRGSDGLPESASAPVGRGSSTSSASSLDLALLDDCYSSDASSVREAEQDDYNSNSMGESSLLSLQTAT